jgi:hypothetical protein
LALGLCSLISCKNSEILIQQTAYYMPDKRPTALERLGYGIKLKASRYYIDYNYAFILKPDSTVLLLNCPCKTLAFWEKNGKKIKIMLHESGSSKVDSDSCFLYKQREYKIRRGKLLWFDKKTNHMEYLKKVKKLPTWLTQKAD